MTYPEVAGSRRELTHADALAEAEALALDEGLPLLEPQLLAAKRVMNEVEIDVRAELLDGRLARVHRFLVALELRLVGRI